MPVRPAVEFATGQATIKGEVRPPCYGSRQYFWTADVCFK